MGLSPRSSFPRKSFPRVFDDRKTTKALEAFPNRLVHCYIHYGCSDGLFLFTALFVCAFFVRDRTSTTMYGTSRSTSRCRTFGVTTHSKIIRVSSIGIWVCHTSHEVKTPWMSRSYIHGVCESIASRSGARFVQGVRCTDL